MDVERMMKAVDFLAISVADVAERAEAQKAEIESLRAENSALRVRVSELEAKHLLKVAPKVAAVSKGLYRNRPVVIEEIRDGIATIRLNGERTNVNACEVAL